MTAGQEWIVDATGCDADALRDLARLRALLDAIVREMALKPVGAPLWHKFPGEGGVTGLVLLSESHLACHTYPEHALATFNLYCCRPRPVWPWEARLGDALGARRVAVRAIPRGSSDDFPEGRP
jgi:S-adenosylmethionine decarboxylase